MADQNRYDVFLSHNSRDKEQVQKIAKYLETQGLKPWLDKHEIYGGDSLPKEIKDAIWRAISAAFFVGVNGLGKWQKEELEILEGRSIDKNLKIIPVLLPGISELPDEIDYVSLRRNRWISIASDDCEKALIELAEGVREELHLWAEKELERLVKDREKAKQQLKEIEQDIRQVETRLGTEEPSRQAALNWLSSVREVADAYGRKALKNFPVLEALVKKKSGGTDEFYAELRICLEFVYYAFRTKDFSCLDRMSVEFSLSDSEIYQEAANPDVYKTSIDNIIEQIGRDGRLDSIASQEITDYLNYLKNKLSILT